VTVNTYRVDSHIEYNGSHTHLTEAQRYTIIICCSAFNTIFSSAVMAPRPMAKNFERVPPRYEYFLSKEAEHETVLSCHWKLACSCSEIPPAIEVMLRVLTPGAQQAHCFFT
jgi:hypothetical protein